MILLQTKALFIDAYRDLNHRKMFWWVLGFTALTILIFSAVGITDNQIYVLGWDIPTGMYSTFINPLAAYKWAFSFLVIQRYMGFAAAILALISTAGIFPDLIASGAIDLYLSKPLGRSRLFLTKYLTGLLFVLLQITLVAVGSFLVMGLRAGFWAPGIFLSIPIVIAFFSYLYAICVFLGVITRSAMAALFLTLLAWALISSLNSLEVWSETAKPAYERRAEQAAVTLRAAERQIANANGRLEKARSAASQAASQTATQSVPVPMSKEEKSALEDLTRWNRERDLNARWANEKAPPELLTEMQTVLFGLNTIVPKTNETLRLLDRVIITDEEAVGIKTQASENEVDGRQQRFADERSEAQKFFRSRNPWWVVGSSLGFEAILVAWACWIFSRRDY